MKKLKLLVLLLVAVSSVVLLGISPAKAYGDLTDVTLKISPNTTGAKATWVTSFTIPGDTDVGHFIGTISGNPIDMSGASAVVTGLPDGYEIILKQRTTCASGCDDFRLWYQNPVKVTAGTRVTITINNIGNPGTNSTGWGYLMLMSSKYPTQQLAYTIDNKYVPLVSPAPACSSDTWSCGSWSTCSAQGSQTRSCSLTTDCPTATTPQPTTNQSCAPPAVYAQPDTTPSCTTDIWSCGSWSTCSASGQQTRSCNMTYDCTTAYTPQPSVAQGCVPANTNNNPSTPVQPVAPSCSADTWSCGDWTACSATGQQTRVCNLTNDCSTALTPPPPVAQGCTPATVPGNTGSQPSTNPTAPQTNSETCTEDIWMCGEWETCSLSGVQGRSCVRTFNCPNAETAPPANYQYCVGPVQPKPVEQNSPAAAANQDTIIKATVKLVCPISDTMASQGSGTVIDQNGTILTNKHVVYQSAGCFVGFITNYSDEPYFSPDQIADIVNISPDQDIAVLKLHTPKAALSFINIGLGNSANLTLGSKLTTYGYPARFGTTLTYTSGDFSGTVPGFLKTTAIIEHGNSGGGAYTADGTFVGMPTAVVKGELNAMGYILSINNINAWLNNRPVAYNPSTDNNYSRVRGILESYSIKKLPSLKLAIVTKAPATTSKNGKVTNVIPDKVEPIKQAIEEKKVQAEKFANSQNNPSISDDNSGAGVSPAKPESWFKRLVRWLKNFF